MPQAFQRACGNKACSYTITKDASRLSFGQGHCNEQGEWEYPCRTCAASAEEVMQEVIDSTRLQLIGEGYNIEQIDDYFASQGWMHNAVLPEVEAVIMDDRLLVAGV
jgi:hypothetical protein